LFSSATLQPTSTSLFAHLPLFRKYVTSRAKCVTR
jgi:hypothetical protein